MADWHEIGETVLGTAMNLPQIAERFDVDEDDIEGNLSEIAGIETCAGCGYWVEGSSLDEGEYCEDCHEDEEEE